MLGALFATKLIKMLCKRVEALLMSTPRWHYIHINKSAAWDYCKLIKGRVDIVGQNQLF
jgi:hypothetical protein